MKIAAVFLFAMASLTFSSIAADARSGPRIVFETNFFDFGKVAGMEGLGGSFKFKNAGDEVLKLQPPQASCDCTQAKAQPDTVPPGGSGEITYTIKADHPLKGQRMIQVRSNDPNHPEVQLTVQLDYSPLFSVSPTVLVIDLPAGIDESWGKATLSRSDGKPLGVDRLTTSEKWISATLDPTSKPEESSAKIDVIVHRPPGPPGRHKAKVQMWAANKTNAPVQSITVLGEAFGEISANPSRLFWVIPSLGKDKSKYPAEALTRKVELKSILGHDAELKNPSSTIKGLSAEIVPKRDKKTFDLLLKFKDLPEGFTNGTVSVETSLESLPRLEVPITLGVPKW